VILPLEWQPDTPNEVAPTNKPLHTRGPPLSPCQIVINNV